MIGRATADLHISERTADWVFQALGEIREDAVDRGGWTTIVGDIFDQPRMVSMPIYNRLRDVFKEWPGDLYVIAGNHDQYDGKRTCLEGLQDVCTLILEPTWTEIGPMVPYVDPSTFWDVLERLMDGRTSELIWTHQGWAGSYLNNMVRDRDGLSSGRLPEGSIVISGHYHMPQSIGPVIYTGSPYQSSFAEEGQAKSWLAWDDDPVVRVPFERVQAPRHHTVLWNPEKGAPEPPSTLRDGDIVRVKTEAAREEASRSINQLVEVGLEGARLITGKRVSERVGVDVSAAPQDAAWDFVVRECGSEDGPNPISLLEWAEEVALWQG